MKVTKITCDICLNEVSTSELSNLQIPNNNFKYWINEIDLKDFHQKCFNKLFSKMDGLLIAQVHMIRGAP